MATNTVILDQLSANELEVMEVWKGREQGKLSLSQILPLSSLGAGQTKLTLDVLEERKALKKRIPRNPLADVARWELTSTGRGVVRGL